MTHSAVIFTPSGDLLLTTQQSPPTFSDIRPVFWEELDLLSLNSRFSWRYPHCTEPLAWADRSHNYFVRGRKVAKARASGYFHKPEIINAQPNLQLYPIDLHAINQHNAPFLAALAQEAVTFIRKTFAQFAGKIDATTAAFSAGKDSIVLLDLMQQALDPADFFAIFNDTDMELAETHAALALARAHWTDITIHSTKSRFKADESWKLFGPPSQIHRWCCYVHKSVPTQLFLRKASGKHSSKILLFDGVRSGESAKRSLYARITENGKKPNQINASPIFHWSETEIYLYMLAHGIFFNKAYRYGMTRIGCTLCPFASKWNDSIKYAAFEQDCTRFVDILADYAKACGKKTDAEIQDFIASHAWAARSGGKFLFDGKNRCSILRKQNTMTVTAKKQEFPLAEWLKPLGTLETHAEKTILVHTKNNLVRIERDESSLNISADTTSPSLFAHISRAVRKSMYCVACGACDALCPVQAINTQAKKIDAQKCIHCGKCLDTFPDGCLAAHSLLITHGHKVNELSKYANYGMRAAWLAEFLAQPRAFLQGNSLSQQHLHAAKKWLTDARFILACKPTHLAQSLANLPTSDTLPWQIFWVNCAQFSPLIRWYLDKIAWGEALDKCEIIQRMTTENPSPACEKAALALFSLFAKTPLATGSITGKNSRRTLEKTRLRLAQPAILLYIALRFAASTGNFVFTLTDLFASTWSPRRIFGFTMPEVQAAFLHLAPDNRDIFAIASGTFVCNSTKSADEIITKFARKGTKSAHILQFA